MKQILRNQSGQSLVQVMMVGAVGIIIALGIATVMTNMQLSANSVKYRSDGDNFNEEMRALLSSPVACTNSFGGLVAVPAATFNIPSLFDGSPAPGVLTYSAGNTYGDQSILLNSMVLANYQVGGAPNTAMMTLTNNLTTKKRALGAQNLVRTINLSLQVDNTNKITSCIALAKMSDGIWQRSQANTNNIFFNGPPAPLIGGNVGIGTTAPLSTLHIVGNANAVIVERGDEGANLMLSYVPGGRAAATPVASGSLIGTLTFHGWGNTGYANVNGNPAQVAVFAKQAFSDAAGGDDMTFFTVPLGTISSTEKMRITSEGLVGIGFANPQTSLDVNGGIRAGNTVSGVAVQSGNPCISEGVIAYDSTAHSPVYCSQALTWSSMGAGGPGTLCGQRDMFCSNVGVATFDEAPMSLNSPCMGQIITASCALVAGVWIPGSISCPANYTAAFVVVFGNGSGERYTLSCAHN